MKNQIKIWIDDIRTPPKNYVWCKDAETALRIIDYYSHYNDENEIVEISFDHDLGEEMSGYDIAKYLVENQINIKCFSVHSMNPVGRNNIIQLLTHYGYAELR